VATSGERPCSPATPSLSGGSSANRTSSAWSTGCASGHVCTAPPAIRPKPKPWAQTDRERAILRFLQSNLSSPEIGRELNISRHTVKTHVVHIYRKLGVSSRSEAVKEARRTGLLGAGVGA